MTGVTEEKNRETKPCCVADAIWGVGQVEVAGRIIGIANLGEILGAVGALELETEAEIRAELLRRVKESNYVPPGMENAYTDAVLSKYRDHASSQRHGCCGR